MYKNVWVFFCKRGLYIWIYCKFFKSENIFMIKYCKVLMIYFLICLGEILKYLVFFLIDLKNFDVSLLSIKVI